MGLENFSLGRFISNTLNFGNANATKPVQNISVHVNQSAASFAPDATAFTPTTKRRVSQLSEGLFTSLPTTTKRQLVDLEISKINKITDTDLRSSKFRDLFIDLLDQDDFTDAAKIINSTPSNLYKNAMFKGLIQEMVASGHYETSINLVNNYPDTRVKNELKTFVSNYINTYGDSSWAAKAEGNDSFLNVTKLKTESVFGSVGNFIGDVGGSVSSLWNDTTKAEELGHNANKIIGKQYRAANLDYGNKACAYAVSQMLKTTKGFENIGSAECNELARQLKANGFQKTYGTNFTPIKGKIEYKAGDVVFFTRSNKNGYGHVGMVAEVKDGIPYMIHNSSAKREVVKIRLDQYYKTPVAVFRPNK